MFPRRAVRRPVRAALLAAVAVAATACSDEGSGGGADDGDAPEGAPIQRAVLADELAAEFTGDHPTRAADREGRCFAGEFLARVDPGELRAEGLVDDDGHLVEPLPELSRGLATTWVTAQQACTDFVASSVEALSAQSKGRLDRRRYRACLEDALTPQQIRAGLVAAVTGDLQGPEVATLSDAQATCSAEALPES